MFQNRVRKKKIKKTIKKENLILENQKMESTKKNLKK